MSPSWMLVVGFKLTISNLLFDKNIIGKKIEECAWYSHDLLARYSLAGNGIRENWPS